MPLVYYSIEIYWPHQIKEIKLLESILRRSSKLLFPRKTCPNYKSRLYVFYFCCLNLMRYDDAFLLHIVLNTFITTKFTTISSTVFCFVSRVLYSRNKTPQNPPMKK